MTGDEKGGEKGEEGERAREGGREGERGKEGEGQKRVRRKKQRNFLVGNIPTIYHLQHATPTTPPHHATLRPLTHLLVNGVIRVDGMGGESNGYIVFKEIHQRELEPGIEDL